MLEKIYKYKITCDGYDGCLVQTYETEVKKGLPEGWHYEDWGDPDMQVRHYCPQCWVKHCRRMVDEKPGNNYRKQLLRDAVEYLKERM